MTGRLIAAPAVEPVPLAEMKAHLSIDHVREDAELTALAVAARAAVERFSRRHLITQTWRVSFDAVPPGGVLELPLAPVQTVSAIKAVGPGGSMLSHGGETVLDLSREPARLIFTGLPPQPARPIAGIEIDIVTGYGASAAAVPAPLVQAVRLLAAHWYETRGHSPSSAMPDDVRALTEDFRIRRLVA